MDTYTGDEKFGYHLGVDRDDVPKFVAGLRRMQMPQHEIQIMVDRFVHRMTIGEITEKRGFVGVREAYRMFKSAMKRAEEALSKKR